MDEECVYHVLAFLATFCEDRQLSVGLPLVADLRYEAVEVGEVAVAFHISKHLLLRHSQVDGVDLVHFKYLLQEPRVTLGANPDVDSEAVIAQIQASRVKSSPH